MRFAEFVLFGLPVALAAPAQTSCTTSTTTTSTSSCTDEYKPTSKPHAYGYGYPIHNGTVTTNTATYNINSYSASLTGSYVSFTTTSSSVTSSSEPTTGSSAISTVSSSSSATDSTTSSATTSETTNTSSSTTTTSAAAPTITGIDTLPACGQTCFNAILGNPNDPAIGCPTADPNCLCTKPNFFNAIRDCSNGACGAVGVDPAPVIAFGAALCAPVITTFTPTTESTTTTPTSTPTNPPVTIPTPAGIENLPPCGQTCINAMLANYADPNISCAGPDPACLCTKPNFFNGIRDCSNGACGAVGVDPAPVIAFGNSYCAPYTGGNTTPTPTPTPDPVVLPTVPGIENQPECGRTCINNMLNLYNDPSISCPTAEKSCFCGSSNFFNGLSSCSAGACQGNQAQIDGVFALINDWCSS